VMSFTLLNAATARTSALTDRPAVDRKRAFTDVQTERMWAIVSALSIRKIAGITATELKSNPTTSEGGRSQGDPSLTEPTATINRRFRSKGRSGAA
jgi:hypothetical protein